MSSNWTEIERLRRELLTLQSAGAVITSSLDLQVILSTVTREMANLLDMRACAIFQWNSEPHSVSLLAKYDPGARWDAAWPKGEEYPRLGFATTKEVLTNQRSWQAMANQPGLDPEEQAHMQLAGIGHALLLPMTFQDRVVGLVEVVDDQTGRALLVEEISLAQLLANQAAGAIENARLYEEIRRHVAEVTTLNRISQVITSVLDLDQVLAIIADHATWLLDVAAASVILYDRESGSLSFGASSGEGSESMRGKRLAAGKGIVDWVIQHGQPQVVPDVSQDPRFFDGQDQENGFAARSVLCVPLKAKGQVIGAIEAINKMSGPFDRGDLTLLASLAASASIAIENARLYEQAQQQIAERERAEAKLRKLNRALRTLGECHELLVHTREETELLHGVCRALVEIGGHRLAWVGFAEQDETKRVRLVAQAGYEQGCLDTATLTWADTEQGRSPTGTAIRAGKLYLVNDVRTDPAFAPWRAQAVERGFGSIVALPLAIEGQILGALTICAAGPDAFDAEEVDLLKGLAHDLAFGLSALRTRAARDRAEDEIRHLYRELQHHANNLEGMVAERTREVQAERDRTRAILEAVGDAVIVTDLVGRIEYLNPAAEALTGYAFEEVAGQSSSLWQQDQPLAVPSPPPGGGQGLVQPQRAEVVSRRKDGTLYDAAMTVAPLVDSQEPDQIVGHVCVQRDITPIKEAERLKDEFVSNVSHELRTPLSVIALVSGNLDMLYQRLPDEKRQKMIRDIRQHAQVLNALIDDVLEVSRIETGHISMERWDVDLAQLAREEVDKQLPLAQKKAQTLQSTGVERLPVWGNGDQLRQVVRNLLNNAIKYTPAQGQIVCHCARLAGPGISAAEWPGSGELPPGRWAALRVADTGIGINQQDLPHIYERFFRVKTQGNIPGTGLGLSIVRELIESHSGRIAAASRPGEGSVFAIYLPISEE